MLNFLIGCFQSSFLPRIGTTNNGVVLQEIIHKMYKSKAELGEIAYKIDLGKAHNNVDGVS